MNLSQLDFRTLNEVAGRIAVPVDWLAALINFETAGTWDPLVKNPNSSARGLIQFVDATARTLGYRDSLDLVQKHPSISSQLRGPVLRYFQNFREPVKSKQDFYMRVFLPAYRFAAPDAVIYSDDSEKRKKFQAANPGVVTVADYVNKLESQYKRAKVRFPSSSNGVFIALALLGFFLARMMHK